MKRNPENAGRNQVGQFVKGASGNPRGKRKGTLHKATRAALALMDGQLEEVTQVLIDKAMSGDMVAVKLVFDKLVPQAKEIPISAGPTLPAKLTAENLPEAMEMIVKAVASGNLLPGEGQVLTGMLNGLGKALELSELEKRVAALEGRKEAEG